MFFGGTVLPENEETKLGSSNQDASPSASKNVGIVLVPYYAWKSAPTTISSNVDIPWVSIVTTQKLLQGLVSHEILVYLSDFAVFFNSLKWPYYKQCRN